MMRYCRLLIAVPVLFALISTAGAVPLFYNELKKDYLDSLKDKKFVEAVEKDDVKCLMCHQGKQKKNRNDFGKVVSKLLTKKDKDKEKIATALKKALATHVDPKKEKSETYMDRLMASKWPGGKLEDLKKDPKKEPGKDGKDAATEGAKKEEK
jgi:hypothetical protein